MTQTREWLEAVVQDVGAGRIALEVGLDAPIAGFFRHARIYETRDTRMPMAPLQLSLRPDRVVIATLPLVRHCWHLLAPGGWLFSVEGDPGAVLEALQPKPAYWASDGARLAARKGER